MYTHSFLLLHVCILTVSCSLLHVCCMCVYSQSLARVLQRPGRRKSLQDEESRVHIRRFAHSFCVCRHSSHAQSRCVQSLVARTRRACSEEPLEYKESVSIHKLSCVQGEWVYTQFCSCTHTARLLKRLGRRQSAPQETSFRLKAHVSPRHIKTHMFSTLYRHIVDSRVLKTGVATLSIHAS